MIEDRLAEDILDGKLDREAVIKLSVKDEQLHFENIEVKPAEKVKENMAEQTI